MFGSGDVALFACHDNQQLSSFLTKHTPMILGTITNDILARSDNTVKTAV